MPRLKDIPEIDQPRERCLASGAESLSKSELLAILIGTGVAGENAVDVSEQAIDKFGRDFLNVTHEELMTIPGIGPAKALRVISAISLVKRFYTEQQLRGISVKSFKDVLNVVEDLRKEKTESLVCLYLNAKNILLKREVISMDVSDNVLFHTRDIFSSAMAANAKGIILIHIHPLAFFQFGAFNSSDAINSVTETGVLLKIPVIDFAVASKDDSYSLYAERTGGLKYTEYVSDIGRQGYLDLFNTENKPYLHYVQKPKTDHFLPKMVKAGYFQIQNRRYLGNKHRLLGFIQDIVSEKCGAVNSFCDIFAGTGVVGGSFNNPNVEIITNDFLASNHACLQTFLGVADVIEGSTVDKINHLNNLSSESDNYFSINFGDKYFTMENAIKIGAVREEIEQIYENQVEKNILLCSLLYAVDKTANTVGHYDAYRRNLDMLEPVKLLIPTIEHLSNGNNIVYKEDANILVKNINCDVLYIDPPYNSRQYSDAYHLLENLTEWKKPEVVGVAKKMNRSHIKSDYCLKSAPKAFGELIKHANCKHILLSYNNTGDSKGGRSNARMTDGEIIEILQSRGNVEIFEREYTAFTTGKSESKNHTERVFYCAVEKF